MVILIYPTTLLMLDKSTKVNQIFFIMIIISDYNHCHCCCDSFFKNIFKTYQVSITILYEFHYFDWIHIQMSRQKLDEVVQF